MPASFILLPAVVIGVIAWLAAWWFTHRARPDSQRDEVERVRNHAAWLEQRLDKARVERWDPAMITCLSDQLGIACRELTRAQRGNRRRTMASQR
jgi:hypothetical protein